MRSRPSLAAVVGSTDTKLLKYKAEIRAQVNVGGKLLEIIEDLEDMVTRLFMAHKEAPDMIFYYRDGVSEGQYPQVSPFLPKFQRIQRIPKMTNGSLLYRRS